VRYLHDSRDQMQDSDGFAFRLSKTLSSLLDISILMKGELVQEATRIVSCSSCKKKVS
jgi:hypothetical protein